MQVANTEWMLGVQLQTLINQKNTALRSSMYCYCDDIVCASTVADLNQEKFTNECDAYFVLHVRDCPYNETCSVNKLFELEDYDDPYLLRKAGIFLLFGDS